MPDETLDDLLQRPSLRSAVDDLGVQSLGVEDVLVALKAFGAVRLVVDESPKRPFVCVLTIDGASERGRGSTALHAALKCWAGTLEKMERYTQRGLGELEDFLLA